MLTPLYKGFPDQGFIWDAALCTHMEVTCPDCGATCQHTEVEKLRDEEPPITVARRQTAFDASITSLTEMGTFAYMVELPCGHKIMTVN